MSKNFHERYDRPELPLPPDRSTGLVFTAIALIVAYVWRNDQTVMTVALALAGILADDGLAQPPIDPLAVRAPHFAPKAKRIIQLFMNGGPSHLDTFDYKPDLTKYAGQPIPGGAIQTERKTGALFPSPFAFKRYGKSGIYVSEIFENVGSCIDDICVINSMKAEIPNHEPSLMLMHCGDQVQVRPSLGSWITYGLGTENRNLPGFVVLCPGGSPIKDSENWRSAFLPGAFHSRPEATVL
jgi:hypothetical protein